MTERGRLTLEEVIKLGSRARGRCESPRRKTILSDDEFSAHLSTAQSIWRKLGVDPLSFVINSENLLEMNLSGKGEEIRRATQSYVGIENSLPVVAESSFCYLPSHLNPHIEAMSEVWAIKHHATPDKIAQASAEVMRRNEQGLGKQLEALFSAIPAITRNALKGGSALQSPSAAPAATA